PNKEVQYRYKDFHSENDANLKITKPTAKTKEIMHSFPKQEECCIHGQVLKNL
ncbi:9835_t:CDS:1, partial [Gigaspora rosea]